MIYDEGNVMVHTWIIDEIIFFSIIVDISWQKRQSDVLLNINVGCVMPLCPTDWGET